MKSVLASLTTLLLVGIVSAQSATPSTNPTKPDCSFEEQYVEYWDKELYQANTTLFHAGTALSFVRGELLSDHERALSEKEERIEKTKVEAEQFAEEKSKLEEELKALKMEKLTPEVKTAIQEKKKQIATATRKLKLCLQHKADVEKWRDELRKNIPILKQLVAETRGIVNGVVERVAVAKKGLKKANSILKRCNGE